MKTTFYPMVLLIAVLLSTLTGIHAQTWTTLNPKPTYETLWDVSFPSPDTGYVAGNNSTIFRTTDGGQNWEKLLFPTPDWQIRGINFISNNTGFITREDGVYKTTDAGESWEFVDIDIITGLEKTWFLNDTVGFAFGFYSALAKTIDGGESWEVLGFSFNEENYYDAIGFADLQTGYIVGKKKFTGEAPVCRRTDDGGQTWTDVEVSNRIETVKGLAVLGPDELWIGAGNSFPNPDTIGADALAFHSVDGGATWQTHVIGLSHTSLGIEGIEFLNPDEGRILNRNHLYTTEDGGLTWSDTYQNGTENQYWVFSAFACLHDQLIYFVGDGPTLVKTTDLGSTFMSLIDGPTSSFSSICFTDSLHGCVGGYKQFGFGPSAFYTEDGGDSWFEASFDTSMYSSQVFDIEFLNTQIGWAVGYTTSPYKTIDGGKNWAYTPTGFDDWFREISIPDQQHIFIAANNGKVIRSTDQGNSWHDISPGIPNYQLQGGFTFISPTTGYLALFDNIKETGKLIKTIDGGTTWFDVYYGYDDPLASLSFSDTDHGVISLSSGEVLITTDGGSTWAVAEIANPAPVDYLKLFDETNGVATIGDHFVAQTHDGGLTFEIIYTGMNGWPEFWRNSFFIDENTGWSCGRGGMIRKYISNTTAISENEYPNSGNEKVLHFYPNPTTGEIWIDNDDVKVVTIFDLSGKQIETISNNESGFCDLSNLESGIYILQIEDAGGIKSAKVIKH